MKIVLLGAPGTGKGTQAQFISKQYKIPIISTGDILRDLIKKKTNEGKIINNYIKNGKLVPDSIITTIIITKILNLNVNHGFILDGFPRTIIQAQELKKVGINVNYVFELILSKNKIIERLKIRRIDSKTGLTYNINDLNKKDPSLLKKLSVRSDDQINIINNRFKEHKKTINSLKKFFIAESKINYLKYYQINGDKSIKQINKEIQISLN